MDNNKKSEELELIDNNVDDDKLTDVQKKIIDIANNQNKKTTSKFINHWKKFNFLYLNLIIFSILIIVVGVCIAKGLMLI